MIVCVYAERQRVSVSVKKTAELLKIYIRVSSNSCDRGLKQYFTLVAHFHVLRTSFLFTQQVENVPRKDKF